MVLERESMLKPVKLTLYLAKAVNNHVWRCTSKTVINDLRAQTSTPTHEGQWQHHQQLQPLKCAAAALLRAKSTIHYPSEVSKLPTD